MNLQKPLHGALLDVWSGFTRHDRSSVVFARLLLVVSRLRVEVSVRTLATDAHKAAVLSFGAVRNRARFYRKVR